MIITSLHFTSNTVKDFAIFADSKGAEGARNKQVLGKKIPDVEQKVEHSHINQEQGPNKGAYNLESLTVSDVL
jgi:hypothetical protein